MTKTPEELYFERMMQEYTTRWEGCPYVLGSIKGITALSLANCDGYEAGYNAAKDQLADADKVMPQWISVKERLPEDGQDVLACVNGQVLISYVHGMKGFSSEWGLAENGETIWPSHWMPLPEPPGKV